MDSAIIVAIISMITTIILNVFQFRNWKSQAKKNETESTVMLMDKALDINKHEIEVLRAINEDLTREIQRLKEEIQRLNQEIKNLKEGKYD